MSIFLQKNVPVSDLSYQIQILKHSQLIRLEDLASALESSRPDQHERDVAKKSDRKSDSPTRRARKSAQRQPPDQD